MLYNPIVIIRFVELKELILDLLFFFFSYENKKNVCILLYKTTQILLFFSVLESFKVHFTSLGDSFRFECTFAGEGGASDLLILIVHEVLKNIVVLFTIILVFKEDILSFLTKLNSFSFRVILVSHFKLSSLMLLFEFWKILLIDKVSNLDRFALNFLLFREVKLLTFFLLSILLFFIVGIASVVLIMQCL